MQVGEGHGPRRRGYHRRFRQIRRPHLVNSGNPKSGQAAVHELQLTTERHAQEELTGTVLHEFGHALALEYKHQHCHRPFDFDREKVYKYFMSSAGSGERWSRESVDESILRVTEAPVTEFDWRSIMCYELPRELLRNPDQAVTRRASGLFAADRKGIRRVYPFLGDTDIFPGRQPVSASGGSSMLVSLIPYAGASFSKERKT
jgi:hypothetical protein